MNRLEIIKERMDNCKNEYMPYFDNNGEMQEWHEMFKDMNYLVQRLERYEEALKEYRDDVYLKSVGYASIADRALKEESVPGDDKIIYTNSNQIVTITKEFLDAQLGEKDWNSETIVKFDKDIFGIGDVIYRLRGKNSSEDNAWDYNVMARENTP